MKACEVFEGSDGDFTKRYYAALERHGAPGIVAVNLFRALKNSTRAKGYRRRGYKDAAYARKAWAMQQLVFFLRIHSGELGIVYGWKQDESTRFSEEASWVLYVELPQYGQVSFHSPERFEGPDYAGDWDGQRLSQQRILFYCDAVYEAKLCLS